MFAADGAHSKVREALGIILEGSSFPEDWPLYNIELDDPLDSESAERCERLRDGGRIIAQRRPTLSAHQPHPNASLLTTVSVFWETGF